MEKAFPIKIGLEIHGYLDTREKLFCMCKTDFLEAKPNSLVCPICTGQPGSKPMAPNSDAIKKMIQIALVFGSKINYSNIVWQRKHYNWADLPKGYQTTISGMHATTNATGGKFKGINLTELHLEEDPAQWNPDSGKINYNRSGLPLIEIVTEPEFSNAEQVIEWLKSLLLSLSYIKAVRKNAGIKVDVNVSTYGERVEMKNLNSLEKIRKAIEYEILRQVENHKKGIIQTRDTLAFDEKLGKTIKMRSKEGAADYRFIPDPDLSMIKIDKKMVNEIKTNLPEMPEVKLARLLKKYNVGEKDAKILTKNLELVEFFEELAKENIDMNKNLSWVTIELLRVLNYNKKTLEDEDVEILPSHLAELIKSVTVGKITVLKGKQIMNDFVPKSFSLKEHKGEISSIDDSAIENLCRQVIDENAHVVDEYKSGKDASLNFLIGQVMRLSERRADFKVAGETLKRLIR
ncbi:MAG: Asp-tRNA(Asn)/Glu-tRNA(Gln) amidotransferase subunit GatB [archaeon]